MSISKPELNMDTEKALPTVVEYFDEDFENKGDEDFGEEEIKNLSKKIENQDLPPEWKFQ